MAKIGTASLSPGQTLTRHLFARSGAKLLSAGVTLTDELCRSIRARRRSDLYLADGPRDERRWRVVVVDVPGGPPAPPEAGPGVSPDAPREERLRERARRLRRADRIVAERASHWTNMPLRAARGVDTIELPETDAPDWPGAAPMAAWREDHALIAGEALGRLAEAEHVGADELLRITAEPIAMLTRYPRRFAGAALPVSDAPTAGSHAFATCAVGAAVAARLGCSRRDVVHASLAGLLADSGMLVVPGSIRDGRRPLDEGERNRVLRHPAHGVALLEGVPGLPEAVRRAVYQHHEREDGSGYPNRLRSDRISDLSRIVAVADAFCAALAARPHRPARRPHDAMADVVRLAGAGAFDKATVRALLRAVGLFPVGSVVYLSSGARAVVVAANPDAVDRPLVRVAPPGDSDGPLVDLAAHGRSLRIIMAGDESPPRASAA